MTDWTVVEYEGQEAGVVTASAKAWPERNMKQAENAKVTVNGKKKFLSAYCC